MMLVLEKITAWCGDRRAATAVEYALLAGIVSISAAGALSAVGTRLSQSFMTVADAHTTSAASEDSGASNADGAGESAGPDAGDTGAAFGAGAQGAGNADAGADSGADAGQNAAPKGKNKRAKGKRKRRRAARRARNRNG